jgi:transcriptional regulator with XRE-family HTH domain
MKESKVNEILKKLREETGYSQEQLANMLDLSRTSVAHIEMWIRKVKAEELQKYSEIFDVNVGFLFWKTDETKANKDYDKEKFIELFLYILEKCWAKYTVWKTVLYKLLYFSEFDFYEIYKKHISWISFVKLPRWPAAFWFDFIINELIEKKELVKVIAPCWNYFQERYIPNRQVNIDIFSSDEKRLIDDVIERYSDYSASEISEESHKDFPWKITKDMDIIDYDLVQNRTYPYSPLARENKKKEVQEFAKISGFFEDLANEPDLYEQYR